MESGRINRLQSFWRHSRPAALCLLFWLIFHLAGRAIGAWTDPALWQNKILLELFQRAGIIALMSLAVVLVSRIRYAGTVLVIILMTGNLLVFADAVYGVIYEWDHRPGNEAVLQARREAKARERETAKPVFERPKIKDPEPEGSTLQAMQSLSIREEDHVPNEPEFRSHEPPWESRLEADTDLGYRNKPLVDVFDSTWTHGILNPVARYSTDPIGRRLNGLPTHSSPEKRYALFFGCSITFGLHVDNDQTLPAFFEGLDTNYRAYNYGVSGYGAHHVLALLEENKLRNQIPESSGVAFYIYFTGHTARAIGDMDSYLSWNATGPYFKNDGNSVMRCGNFKDGRWLISRLYEFIPKTYIGRYYDMHLPGSLQPRHYRLTARIIKKAADDYARQFGNDRFYVVLLPGFDEDRMGPYLQELGLHTIDLTAMFNSYWDDKYQFKGDGHPRPLFYRLVADRLHQATSSP
jgi:hypothetical protein